MLHKFWLVGVALCVFAVHARAEIRLDHQYPWTEDQVGYRLSGVHSFTAAIDRDQVAQGLQSESVYETLHFFRMLWDERTFYVAGVQYRSKEQNAARDAALARGKHSGPIAGGGICAFFVYDANLKQLAKHDIMLNEADGHTWCNGVRGLARVKGQDAILFSLSYYLTGQSLAKRREDIGKGWRYMTVLLKLRERNGQVFVEQDDACLQNPNLHQDLLAARRALAACVEDAPARRIPRR